MYYVIYSLVESNFHNNIFNMAAPTREIKMAALYRIRRETMYFVEFSAVNDCHAIKLYQLFNVVINNVSILLCIWHSVIRLFSWLYNALISCSDLGI